MSYFTELRRAMKMLADDPSTVFVGQAVRFGGQRAHETFADVPMDKRIEMPVAENFQVGFSTGLALQGYLPVSFFPRMDFLICGMDQLVNHLDKLPLMGAHCKVIIRTAVGSSAPLDPGPQHTGDYCNALRGMLKTVEVLELLNEDLIVPLYRQALTMREPCIVVERMEWY